MTPRERFRYGLWVWFTVSVTVALACTAAPAAELTTTQIAEKALPATVTICVPQLGQGSGVLLDDTGSVLTCYHVITGAKSAVAKMADGGYFPVQGLLGFNPKLDVAVLKIQGDNLPHVRTGDSDLLKPGDKVVAIGSPRGLENSVSEGVISAIRRVGDFPEELKKELIAQGRKPDDTLMQFTAPTSPGSSGGPLINASGEVVGIVILGFRAADNVYFAYPVNDAKHYLSSKALIRLDELDSTWLGGPASGPPHLAGAEWGLRMLPIVKSLLTAVDLSIDGERKTLEPHEKAFDAGKWMLSQDIYRAKALLDLSLDDVSSFRSSDKALESVRLATASSIEKTRQAITREIEILKTVPTQGFAEFNSCIGEVGALFQSGMDGWNKVDGGFPDGLVRAFERHCPDQVSSLPAAFRAAAIPQVECFVGFTYWMSLDEMRTLRLQPDSPAMKAGLRPGDVFVGAEKNTTFGNALEYESFMRGKKAGDVVRFDIKRDGKPLVIVVKLAAR